MPWESKYVLLLHWGGNPYFSKNSLLFSFIGGSGSSIGGSLEGGNTMSIPPSVGGFGKPGILVSCHKWKIVKIILDAFMIGLIDTPS